MRNPKGVKREFLEKWMKGLKKLRCLNNNHHTSLLQRKNAIKLSADLAMASTRSRATRWSRALIDESRWGPERPKVVMKKRDNNNNNTNKVVKNIMRMVKKKRCSRVMNMMSWKTKMKKKNCLVEKRKRKLKSLLPGGESMKDDVALIEETLDYIQSLRAQVEVMRSLANFN